MVVLRPLVLIVLLLLLRRRTVLAAPSPHLAHLVLKRCKCHFNWRCVDAVRPIRPLLYRQSACRVDGMVSEEGRAVAAASSLVSEGDTGGLGRAERDGRSTSRGLAVGELLEQ